MVGCKTDERGAEKSVRPCRENPYLLAATLYWEIHFSAFALADPVSLHRDNPFGPSRKLVASL